LVRDRGRSANRFPRLLHRAIHLLPVKPLMLKQPLILRNPKMLQSEQSRVR
jgi:hypothetical protein